MLAAAHQQDLQPQLESWDGFTLKANAAVEIDPHRRRARIRHRPADAPARPSTRARARSSSMTSRLTARSFPPPRSSRSEFLGLLREAAANQVELDRAGPAGGRPRHRAEAGGSVCGPDPSTPARDRVLGAARRARLRLWGAALRARSKTPAFAGDQHARCCSRTPAASTTCICTTAMCRLRSVWTLDSRGAGAGGRRQPRTRRARPGRSICSKARKIPRPASGPRSQAGELPQIYVPPHRPN